MENRIRKIRRDRDLTIVDLAEQAGITHSYLSRIETGKRDASLEVMIQLASALRVPLSDLVDEAELLPEPNGTGAGDAEPVGNAKPAPLVKVPNFKALSKDVPVLGTAMGGDGNMSLSGIIDYVRRPEGVKNAVDVYALYIVGESMEPKFDEGDLVYVSERRPVKRGDYVVIQCVNEETGESEAMIKKLVKRDANKVHISQFNPRRDIELDARKVSSIHKVLSLNDLHGV